MDQLRGERFLHRLLIRDLRSVAMTGRVQKQVHLLPQHSCPGPSVTDGSLQGVSHPGCHDGPSPLPKPQTVSGPVETGSGGARRDAGTFWARPHKRLMVCDPWLEPLDPSPRPGRHGGLSGVTHLPHMHPKP